MRTAAALLTAIICTACTREPRQGSQVPEAPPPAAALPPVVTPDAEVAVAVADFPWEGDTGFPSPRQDDFSITVNKDDQLVFQHLPQDDVSVVHLIRMTKKIWTHTLPGRFVNDAALVADRQRVYVVFYGAISSGADVMALDLMTGQKLWQTPVRGLGPISHSKYANHVVVALKQGHLVVYGNEASGRYIEVFDPET